MQLYELEKRLTMNVKALAKEHNIKMDGIVVNVQTSKGAFGHFSARRWKDGEKYVHELALNPEYFSKPLEVVDTIIHELVHVYCDQNSIKDTSRAGYYHNKKFKEVAEKFGLKCIPTEAGWNTTPEGNEAKLEEINKALPYPVTGEMVRRGTPKKRAEPKERTPKHKYTCPFCGTEITHKDIIFVSCFGCIGYPTMILDLEDKQFDEWDEKRKKFEQLH